MSEEKPPGITDFELMAYVDQQLDAAQRLEVEDYVSRHPELAAQVMADMRTRDALRIAGGASLRPLPARTKHALSRLDSALTRRRNLGFIRWPAAFAAFAGIGWIAHGPIPSSASAAPSIIDDAVMAHRTSLLRAGLPSQIETAAIDTAELGRAARVQLPAMPEDWNVTDVQLFPSDDGPGVQIAIDPPGAGETMSLFVVESADEVPSEPVVAERGTARVAYWRRGQTTFALTGDLEGVRLAALDLADNPLR